MMDSIRKTIGKAQRMIAAHVYKTPLLIPDGFRAVSFCFDDFPASADLYGAKMLEDAGARGTFYACFSMLGNDSPSGAIASVADVRNLHARGHEVGCHTYDHLNCSFTPARRVAASCRENTLAAETHGIKLAHFAYPQGGMSAGSKKIMRNLYKTARSTGRGVNRGMADAHGLKANPIYEGLSRQTIHDLIDDTGKNGGWLILYTHDVSDAPSQYGISKAAFKDIIARCTSQGLPVRTVGQAMNEMGSA